MIKFAFRKNNGTLYEKAVAACTGQFVHVDLIIFNRAYTAYMNETFSENDVDEDSNMIETLSLQVTTPEQLDVLDWVKQHVDNKTPYNYSDLYLCVLKFHLPRMLKIAT